MRKKKRFCLNIEGDFSVLPHILCLFYLFFFSCYFNLDVGSIVNCNVLYQFDFFFLHSLFVLKFCSVSFELSPIICAFQTKIFHISVVLFRAKLREETNKEITCLCVGASFECCTKYIREWLKLKDWILQTIYLISRRNGIWFNGNGIGKKNPIWMVWEANNNNQPTKIRNYSKKKFEASKRKRTVLKYLLCDCNRICCLVEMKSLSQIKI